MMRKGSGLQQKSIFIHGTKRRVIKPINFNAVHVFLLQTQSVGRLVNFLEKHQLEMHSVDVVIILIRPVRYLLLFYMGRLQLNVEQQQLTCHVTAEQYVKYYIRFPCSK